MKNIFISFAFLFVAGCGYEDEIPAEFYSNRFTEKMINTVSRLYGLRVLGTGGQIDEDKIKNIFIGFLKREPSTEDEARKLIVDISKLFITTLEEYKESHAYLMYSPDSQSNIRLSISFIGNDDKKDAIIYIRNFLGKIDFSYRDEEDLLVTYRKETFEEAEQILAEQNKIGVEAANNAEPT